MVLYRTTPKADTKGGGEQDSEDTDARVKKEAALQTAMNKLQKDFNKDEEKSFEDAKKLFEKNQSDKLDAVKDLQSARISAIKNGFDRERALLNAKLKDDEKKYNGNADAIGNIRLAHSLRISQINKKEAEEYEATEKKKRDIAIQAGREVADSTTAMLQDMGTKSKAAANAYKVIASATTLIDTYRGAQAAFVAMTEAGGPWGVALGIGAAAAATATGLYRVSQINSQSFASGTKGLSSGTWATVGEMGPELTYIPANSPVINHHKSTQIFNSQGSGTNLYVTVQADDGSVSSKFARELRNGAGDYVVKKLMRKMRLT